MKVFILVIAVILLVGDVTCRGDKCSNKSRKECKSTPGCKYTGSESDEFQYSNLISYVRDCQLVKKDGVMKDIVELFNDEW